MRHVDRAASAVTDGRSPAEIAEELKAESDRLLHVDPPQALRVAEQIGGLADLAADERLRALGQLAEADALRKLGRYQDAIAAYGRAATLYQALEDEVGWARTRIGAAVTWRYTGVTNDELRSIDPARAILSRRGLWLRLARLEQHAGLLLCELGQLEQAIQAYERAIDAAARIEPRDPAQEARIVGNLALVWQRVGEYERAGGLISQALAVFEEHGHDYELAVGRSISAQLLADQGHYSRALETANSSRRAFLELRRVNDAAFVGRVAAYCLLSLNRLEEGVDLASAVAAEFEASGAGINVAGTLLLRSACLRRLGRYTEALADLERSEAIFASSDCGGWVAVVAGERAAVLASAGDWHAAATQARAAASELTRRGQRVNAAQTNLVEAAALRALGQSAAARTTAETALASIRERGVPWLDYQAWRVLAELDLQAGQARQALGEFDAAIQALEQVQGRILTEARADFLADKLEVYERAVALCVELGDSGAAFEYSERARSRALVDALAGQLDIHIRPRSAIEERLEADLTRLRRRHEQLTSFTATAVTTLDADQMQPREVQQAELDDCERQIRALLDELRLGNVADLERVALLQGTSYPLDLEPGTMLIEYFSTDDDLYVFTRTSVDGVRALRLSGARARVERLTSSLYLVMHAAAGTDHSDRQRLHAQEVSARRVLHRLHAELIGPLADSLTGADRLVIVPHGMLHRIPFAALYDGAEYLVQQLEVVVGPSASALAFCRRPIASPRASRLVVGHSDNGSLPGVLAEARQVAVLLEARTLLETDATREQIVEHAREADVIHLATHGFARVDAPLFSYLKLEDGQLTALDCFDLELECSLVTLSACESGRAQIAPGDEQLGLPRALLYAGAHSVVQTLWRVDDQTTARLMKHFYAGLRAGHGRAQALRAAQLEILCQTPGRSHPFFWAPVVLLGDWGALRPLPVSPGN
ncbi:MAG: CHAT domain-containing protein [Chloroflexi bacterium]|nr:CHAT domain-containing protein [Chloroflexota bacterium]